MDCECGLSHPISTCDECERKLCPRFVNSCWVCKKRWCDWCVTKFGLRKVYWQTQCLHCGTTRWADLTS